MKRTGKRSESPYNEVNITTPAVQGVYNYLALWPGGIPPAPRGPRYRRYISLFCLRGGRIRSLNAIADSFFATLECELLERRSFQIQAEARVAIFEFLAAWHKTRRRHSALGYLSPNDYERAAGPATTHPWGNGDQHDRTDKAFRIGEPEAHKYAPGVAIPPGLEKTFTCTGCRPPQCWRQQPSTVHRIGVAPENA